MSDERRLADEVADDIFGYSQIEAFSVVSDIVQERAKQDTKWGIQNHTQMLWLGILAEEFGEAAKEINKLHFSPLDNEVGLRRQKAQLREELIQVAAVAVAMVESLDRNGK